MSRLSLIDRLISEGVISKKLRASPRASQLLQSSPLLPELITATAYLPATSSIRERLLNIRLGIDELPTCDQCGASLAGRIYESQLRYHRFCDQTCRHEYVTAARIKAMLEPSENGSKAQQAAKKSVITQQERKVDGKSVLQNRIERATLTRAKNGNCVPLSQKQGFEWYRGMVMKITNQQPLHLLPNFELRGPAPAGWQLDHRYSVLRGYLDEVPPEIIGHFFNLEMLPFAENHRKGPDCSITLELLMSKISSVQPPKPHT